MLPFRKILFPVDYSDACRAIVPHVKDALGHFSAELALVHAYGPEGLSFVDLPLASPELPQQVREFEQARVRDFAQEFFPDDRAQCFAELGEAGTVIRHVLEHQGADLVMLPTHGRGPVRRLMLGSVATKVLHDASCAVWTATGAAAARPVGGYRAIACAADESDEASAVIVAAAALAKSYGASLSVVHVLGMIPMAVEVDYAAIRNVLLESARHALRERLDGLGVTAEHAVVEGNIPHSLQQWAADHNADLMVVGRGQAQEGMGRVWSNLYSIVRESPCPVLSI